MNSYSDPLLTVRLTLASPTHHPPGHLSPAQPPRAGCFSALLQSYQPPGVLAWWACVTPTPDVCLPRPVSGFLLNSGPKTSWGVFSASPLTLLRPAANGTIVQAEAQFAKFV
ncbi:hypothetical protein E2C01_046265 [Portunus trituberculatus]|uniref:Uncharacterized protein n=1 Tax=Portunus trituberculatus TaxID=210409 RepID=A0A5B7G476_PORTR|nr:hypothetical protein [Portunus trituberculatus]